MSAEPEQRLPFEPRQKKNKKPKKNPAPTTTKKTSPAKTRQDSIPEVVSKRMIRRMVLFSGIPTTCAIATFVISYFLITQASWEIPTPLVLSLSSGFFLLGVAGLSYGVISASWDEGRVGGWWGWQEFTTNFGRMRSAWREQREEAKGK